MRNNTMGVVVVMGLLVVAMMAIAEKDVQIADLTRSNQQKDGTIFGLRRDLANAQSRREQAEAGARAREAELQEAKRRIAQLTMPAGSTKAG